MLSTMRLSPILATATVALLLACAPPPETRTLHVYGDSITFGVQLDGTMTNTTFNSVPCRAISYGSTCVAGDLSGSEILAGELPPTGVIVLEIGTNDAHRPDLVPDLRLPVLVKDVLASIPLERCVAWVLIHDLDHLARSEIINTAIRHEMALRPCAQILDWPALATADPSLMKDPLHPSALGNKVYAALLRDAA